MTPAPVIPLGDPLPLPAPAGLLWALLLVTFLVHTVAMNLLLGGSFLSLVWRFGRAGDDAPQRRVFLAWFSQAAPVLMALTVTLGVAPLLFLQALYGRLFFVSAILMGVPWLGVVPLLIGVYYGFYALAFGAVRLERWALALSGALTAGLVVVALLYTANFSLMLRPETFLALHAADGLGLRLPLADRALLPRLLHTLLSAVAVAAIGVVLLGVRSRERDAAFADWAVRRGLLWFGWATAANIAVGLWYLVAQPRSTLERLFAGEFTGVALVGLTFLLPLLLVVPVPLALRSTTPARTVWHLVGTLASTLVVMALLRDQVRAAALARAGFTGPYWIEPQWGAIGLFVLLLALGAATVFWMVRALARGGAPRT